MDNDDLFKEDESRVNPVVGNDFRHENGVRITQVEDNEFRTPTKIVNSGVQEPQVGMIFKTSEEALKFYETYGVSKGFSVVTRSSRKNWTRCDLFTSMTFACSHYGSYNKRIDDNVPTEKRRPNTSTMRGECEAQLNIVRDKNTHKWRISGFKDAHNHDFVSPSKTNFLSVNRKMPDVAKNMVEAFQRENLPVHKVTDILGGDVNGFNNRSCWNHLRDVRQKIDVGDAQWAYQYFQNRSLENPQFFYAIQCDGEGRAVNFFWVDARSRMSYKQFGDVVSFDTTYKTNKYGLPFAPFTGVNHNFQTIQFGCALLQDETEESFIWLFETWKKAMGGVEPVSIITDSDAAMKAAIPKVFPSTRHRLCYWHIKKNFAANLGHLYFKKSPFKREMKECLKFTFRIKDFEEKWAAIVAKYNLETNTWLAGLYENRFAWVPVYNRTAFFAGMNSTGRSEGINAFFKDYVRSSTSLMEFIEMYDKALKKLEKNEREEDYKTEQTYRLLTSDSYLLRHAKGIYTRRAFEKFKRNWDRVEKYKSDVSSSDPNIHVVKYKMGIDEHWLVKLCLQTFEGSCECHLFEFVGIPCAHLLKVFSKLDMVEIPEFFIMKRWLKGANKYRVIDNEECVSEGRGNIMELSQLCHEATQVACVAIKTKEGGKMYLDTIRELGEKINQLQLIEPDKEVSPIILPCNDPPAVLLDPNVTKTKGRPTQEEKKKSAKDARFKHPIEEAQGKKRRICTGCDKPASHNRSTCPVWKAREASDFLTHSEATQNSSNKN